METAQVNQELDYQWLLLSHINRMSMMTTGQFQETDARGSRSQSDLSVDALSFAVRFLRAIIPDDLVDEKYREGIRALNEKKQTFTSSQFDKFELLINLLHRRGLLMPTKSVGLAKPVAGEAWEA